MAKINKIIAREILDSRGNPTVETKIILDGGLEAKAAVPSGASTGSHEALELRDGDLNRFLGKGVLRAVNNVNQIIAPSIIGMDVGQQTAIDQKMIDLDATPNKSKLGANAILSVSLAVCRAAALDQRLPIYKYIRQGYNLALGDYRLPVPTFNVINGGKHSDSGLDVQEFLVIPWNKVSFSEQLRMGVEIFNALREVLEKRKLTFAVGDEGGFAPKMKNVKSALDLLISIADFTRYKLGEEVFFGLDAAASVFYRADKKKYHFEGHDYSTEQMSRIYLDWLKKYPLISLEDPLDEDDWTGWQILTQKATETRPEINIIGDDIFSTNLELFKRGVVEKTANTLLVKPNQVGTLTETIACINEAIKNKYKLVVSHRSGETNDDFIADLAVAVNADYIKTGAPNRGERVAKYNRLLEIEQELKK